MDDPKPIPLSALQHFAFCPRQCALIHNEQLWADNWHTAKGNLLHERVDSGEPETRKGVRFERSVHVNAPKLRLVGQLDLLEFESASGRYTPVEYKKGKSKTDDWDRIQLCAQALCLEEMLGVSIDEGALWYWQTRRREQVRIDAALRQQTHGIIQHVIELFDSKITPKAKFAKHCLSCSLIDVCAPKCAERDKSLAYVETLFGEIDGRQIADGDTYEKAPE